MTLTGRLFIDPALPPSSAESSWLSIIGGMLGSPVNDSSRRRISFIGKSFLLVTIAGLLIVASQAGRLSAERGEPALAVDQAEILISDSLFLYSPSVLAFDVQAFLDDQAGPLSDYVEEIDGQTWPAAESIQHNAMRFGLNPQLILTLLDAQRQAGINNDDGLPKRVDRHGELTFYANVIWLSEEAMRAYDEYRSQPSTAEIVFPDGQVQAAPTSLNSGTYAVQATLAQFMAQEEWAFWVGGPEPKFREQFGRWFGDPSLDPDLANKSTITAPSGYQLPFTAGETWHYTGGPHYYGGGTPGCTFGSSCPRPWSAVDIAPPESISCPWGAYPAHRWLVAPKGGSIIYSGQALVVIDHGDGWRTYYSHVSAADRRDLGGVNQGDRLGHPSCEVEPGGFTTGVHIHFALYQVGIGFVNIQGASFAGWVVGESSHYNGTMTQGDIHRQATVGRFYGTNDVLDYGPGTCPQSGGVILYKHANYSCGAEGENSGYLKRSNSGFLDLPATFNDQASALRVSAGGSVRLFEHSGGAGASVCRSGNDPSFDGDVFAGGSTALNDRITSIEVFDNGDCSLQPSHDNWLATYFRDKEQSEACGSSSAITGTYVLQDWGQGGPVADCGPDNWSARFSRLFDFSAGNYTFNLGSDDWGRLKLNGETIVDNWMGAGEQTDSRWLADGTYEITVDYADTSGSARLSAWWSGPGYSLPDEEREPGQWYAQYWGNRALWWQPLVSMNEGAGFLTHNWGNGGPGYGLPDERFSGRFERAADFECGIYKFRLLSDDGVRFWIDGQLMLDKWFDQGDTFDLLAVVDEGSHELKVEHYENSGNAAIILDWSIALTCPLPDPLLYMPLFNQN
jgi:hypothetical protein